MADLAALVARSNSGDPAAATLLFEALYAELHQLAERQLRKNGGGVTLGATTLLHEAYLALSRRDSVAFVDRARFMGYAAKVMRGLIVDYARARRAQKRGGEFEITLIGDRDVAAPAVAPSEELDGINLGIERLAAVDPGLAQLVDLHFFCGFSFAEIGAFRGVSERTIQRDWRKARILLEGMVE